MIDQMKLLLKNEFFDSAEIIGSFLLSNNNDSISEIRKFPKACGRQMEYLYLYADAIYGKKEYRRAIVRSFLFFGIIYNFNSNF